MEKTAMRQSMIQRTPFCQLFLVALLSSFLVGCQRNQEKSGPEVTPSNPPQTKTEVKETKNEAVANLHKPFKEAIVAEPPDGVKRPPDTTVAGKNIAKIYEQIVGAEGKGGLWEQIRFTTPEGKRLRYQATIKMDLGKMQIDFFPEAAPNHVRNFIALARVGYYDGLAFDRIIRDKVEDQPWAYLEAGCPLSTGEAGLGSIGYWLQPEISSQLTHEEGTVGAWHAEALETAACKFYITLTKAPWFDKRYTIFGKITQGLDVARKISERPVQEDDRPQEPVVIREITIQTTVEENPVTGGKK